jgi:hypothetical protein
MKTFKGLRRILGCGLSGWNGLRIAPFLFLLAIVCGCTSVRQPMVGRYESPGGDSLVIKKNSLLYWSPSAKEEPLSFVGVGSRDSGDRQFLWITVPSSSPFIGAAVRFSPDYSHATINWGDPIIVEHAADGRSTEFQRTPGQ